jgi:hypothetical protein
MDESITISKASLVQLIGDLYPDPNDPGDPSNPWGPYGPIGPVISWALRHVSWALLNPQPLPPVAGPGPVPWSLAGPGPQPWIFEWRSGPRPIPWLARMVIDRIVAEYQFAEVAAGARRSEGALEGVRIRISEFVDDFCGTRPPRWPLPWPWPPKLDPAQIRSLDLLMAGAQFQRAADAMADNPLQADFTAAADRLLETGLKRLESDRRSAPAAT